MGYTHCSIIPPEETSTALWMPWQESWPCRRIPPIIPGHGPLGSKADLTAAHDTVATIRDRVAAAKKSGKSLDETVASKPSADFDAKFGKGMIGPDLIVTLVYKTLS